MKILFGRFSVFFLMLFYFFDIKVFILVCLMVLKIVLVSVLGLLMIIDLKLMYIGGGLVFRNVFNVGLGLYLDLRFRKKNFDIDIFLF